MSYILQALKRAEADRSAGNAPAPARRRPLLVVVSGPRWSWVVAGAVALSVLVGGSVFLLTRGSRSTVRAPAPAAPAPVALERTETNVEPPRAAPVLAPERSTSAPASTRSPEAPAVERSTEPTRAERMPDAPPPRREPPAGAATIAERTPATPATPPASRAIPAEPPAPPPRARIVPKGERTEGGAPGAPRTWSQLDSTAQEALRSGGEVRPPAPATATPSAPAAATAVPSVPLPVTARPSAPLPMTAVPSAPAPATAVPVAPPPTSPPPTASRRGTATPPAPAGPAAPGPVAPAPTSTARTAPGGSKLKIEALLWSENPKDRMVFIGGRKYVEGQSLTSGAVIEEIAEDGIVLLHDGERVRVKAETR